MAATDVRLATREKRLRAQFTAMESALAASQSAQSQLTAQLNAL
jgi:flagellar capping protein FliD